MRNGVAVAAEAKDNLAGSTFMLLAMAGFSINDAIIKWVGQTLNLGQALMLRGVFATLLILLAARLLGQWRSPSILLDKRVLIRTAGEIFATACFVTAIFNMPIGNATAILQALPLALTASAALFFGEAVGWRRMLAICIGFSGVLLIVRPGYEGFNEFSLLAILTVVGCVFRDLATRGIPKAIPGMMIALISAIGVTLMGATIALFQPWNPVGIGEIAPLMLCSTFLVAGYYFIIAAMRSGDIGFVSPFRYSVLIYAMLFGYFIFDETPDILTLAGSAIIVATGVYTLYRERIVRKQKITPPPSR